MFRRIAALPILLLLAACNWSECGDCLTSGGNGPKIEGSGTMKTEIRPVEKFTAIRLSDLESSLLVIERTGEESLSVTADDNLLALFTSTVKDGMLRLAVAKGNSFHGKRPTYKITVNDRDELDGEVSGAGIIWYIGSPKLNSNVNGIGMITRYPFGS